MTLRPLGAVRLAARKFLTLEPRGPFRADGSFVVGAAVLLRNRERAPRDLATRGGVEDLDTLSVVDQLEVGPHGEVVDSDQRRLDRTEFVEVGDDLNRP